MKSSKTPDQYYQNLTSFKTELESIRGILLETGLQETIKWGIPVYTFGKDNVVGVAAFKSYFGIWFYQGSLLNDSYNLLINAQEGVTKALRQYRMNSKDDIKAEAIKEYVFESIENFKNDRKVLPEKKNLYIPTLLQNRLDKSPDLSDKFNSLTNFKKREYAEYIDSAKRESTKMDRLEKIVPMILEGIGLNDKYRK